MALSVPVSTSKQAPGAAASLTSDAIATQDGDLLVVGVTWYLGDALGAITDSGGHTWQLAEGPSGAVEPSPGGSAAIFYAENVTGSAAHTVTFTPDQTTEIAMSVLCVRGAPLSSALRSADSFVGTATEHNTPYLTAGSDNEIFIGTGAVTFGVEGTAALDPGSPWTLVDSLPGGTPQGIISAYRVVGPAEIDRFRWSVASVHAAGNCIAAFGAFVETDPEVEPETPDYEVTIGEETGLNPLLETFKIQETLDAPDVAIFDIESAGSPFLRFSLGDTVFVTENGVRIFGGYVTGLRERGFSGPNGNDFVVEIQATSYELNAQRRVITEQFSGGSPAESLEDILTQLVDDYLDVVGVTLHPSQATGPSIPTQTFERVRGDQVLRSITESIGYLYSIDFENRLRAWAPGDIAAPFDYDEDVNPERMTGDIEVEKQLQNGYANKVILVGEPIVVPDHIDPFTGDGAEDTFPLTYKVGGPFPYVADGAVGYGVVRYTADNSTESIGGVEAPGGFFWEYDPFAQTIRRRGGAPGNGVQFSIQYHGLFIPNAEAEDAGEIAQYGLWEHVEHVTAVTDNVSAQELADALLAQKLASKSEIATLSTRELGFHPGQTIGIESPLRELTGDFLITQVDTVSESGSPRLVRRITAAKSENNDHDWRKVIQQWSDDSTGSSTSAAGSASSTTSSAGAGLGLHATHHEAGGIDEVTVEQLPTASGSAGDVLTHDGAGGSSWEPPTGGGSPSGSSFYMSPVTTGGDPTTAELIFAPDGDVVMVPVDF
jgi:hypothetical protein